MEIPPCNRTGLQIKSKALLDTTCNCGIFKWTMRAPKTETDLALVAGDFCCSVTQAHLTFFNLIDYSMPSFSTIHNLIEIA